MQSYALRLPTPTRLAEEDLAALDLPVLVVFGGRSPMHDSASGAEVARRVLRDGVVEVYPGATHTINGEHPQADDLGRFLALLR